MERIWDLVREIDSLLPTDPLDPSDLTVEGTPGFSSAFDVDGAALATAGFANLVFGAPVVNPDRLRMFLLADVDVDGSPVPKWATLSGYYDTADGRNMQLHCNFPQHGDGVVSLLGCEPTRQSVQAAILNWDPLELEGALIDAGMIGAYIRTIDEWNEHPHALATADLPLISVEQIGEAEPRHAPVDDGLTSQRVLDCSRVLAGPVAGQLFAAHGADVLRIDSPTLPSVDVCVMTTGGGKRNAHLDLRNRDDATTFQTLLDTSDIWIDAYRPGGLAGLGFAADAISPGGVVAQLSAFDWVGPWAGRRGFDSIVQSTTGIVSAGARAASSNTPTSLPVQALDFMTGFIAAAAAERMRQHQRKHGGTWLVRSSLLRTRNWLLSLGGPKPFTPSAPQRSDHHRTTMQSSFGSLTVPLPISGSITHAAEHLGTGLAAWGLRS